MKAKLEIKGTIDQLDSLCRAVEAMQEALHCTDKQMFQIVLVLEELVANAINHGGCDRVEVELDKQWEELVITLRDNGKPFDPTTLPSVDVTTPLDKRCTGGLGVHLVNQYTDCLAYRREGGINIVVLKKTI